MSGASRRHYQSWEYLAKPFRPAELIEAVSRAVYASARS
jgi:CheY-like chemotaxis protein